MKEKVYLETDDEITSVIDKIKKTKTDNAEIVVPQGATLIQSIVNLKLLKRQSDLLRKKIILVINDEQGMNLAKKVGLNIKTKKNNADDLEHKINDKENSTPESMQMKINTDIDSEKNELIKNKKDNADKNISKNTDGNFFSGITKKIRNIDVFSANNSPADSGIASKREVNKFFKLKSRDKVHLLPSVNLRSFLIFFGISILVIMLIFALILPTANIFVDPKTEPFNTSFDVVISNNVDTLDIENLILPGETISHEEKSEKKEFNATGEKEVGEKSRGEIIVYNNYSSEPITLVAATRFLASDKLFYTMQEITIPGASIEGGLTVAGKTKVRVEAESEGEEYNIAPSRFSIPNLSSDKQQRIYGESISNFTGGFSKTAKVISEEDYENAKNQLFESTFDIMVESLINKINEGKVLAVGIMKKEITEINSNPGVGEESDFFELDMQVKVFGYLIKNDDIAAIINNKFVELLPENKFIINDEITEGVEFEPIDGIVSDENSSTAKINITKQVAWKLDENKIRTNISGKNIEEAKAYLIQDSNILDTRIELWPFWVNKIPKNLKKIKISLDTDNNSGNITNN